MSRMTVTDVADRVSRLETTMTNLLASVNTMASMLTDLDRRTKLAAAVASVTVYHVRVGDNAAEAPDWPAAKAAALTLLEDALVAREQSQPDTNEPGGLRTEVIVWRTMEPVP